MLFLVTSFKKPRFSYKDSVKPGNKGHEKQKTYLKKKFH